MFVAPGELDSRLALLVRRRLVPLGRTRVLFGITMPDIALATRVIRRGLLVPGTSTRTLEACVLVVVDVLLAQLVSPPFRFRFALGGRSLTADENITLRIKKQILRNPQSHTTDVL